MKRLLQNFLPNSVLHFYKKNIKNIKFKNKNIKETFTEIYSTNHWNSEESISGKGSDIEQTAKLIHYIDQLIQDKSISTILDVPCGDFNWMCRVNMKNVRYVGGDIVEPLIVKNIQKYKEVNNINFKVVDLTTDSLDTTDLLICRDCLVHLSFNDIKSAIRNIKKSGSTYLLTTSFVKQASNYDIITGDWRPLNLTKPPFLFPEPIDYFIEDCTEANGSFEDKAICLWHINSLPVL